MSRVVYRPAADDDFFGIADHISEDNPDRAFTFINEIRNACEHRAYFPYSGRALDSIHPGLRRFVHHAYMIYYFVLAEGYGIEVVHIIHGARDHERIVRDDLDSDTSP